MRHTSSRSSKAKVPQRRQDMQQEDGIPAVYLEMLAEVEAETEPEPHGSVESERPAKRRKVGERAATLVAKETSHQSTEALEDKNDDSRQLQTTFDFDASSEGSDIEWEEIAIQQDPLDSAEMAATKVDDEPLQLTLGTADEEKKKSTSRRKPLSAAAKQLRLDIHKVHLLCLLRHVHIRNIWCNDPLLQDHLKPILSRNIISLLNPHKARDKLARSRMFMDGLNRAGDMFRKIFKVTCAGMRRAHWSHTIATLDAQLKSIMSNTELFLSLDDYRKQARQLRGSRDFGAQLFCALLRSVAVEARLVCSLQPLPFSGTTRGMPPQNPKSYYATISSDAHKTSPNEEKDNGFAESTSRPAIRRLGQPQFLGLRPAATSSTDVPTKPLESSFPVFWVEAFNEGAEKWITVDFSVTKSLGKPHKLEPPASDPLNMLSYVVAFDEDTTARDVTRRYARAYNAKTQRLRVECIKGGKSWWENTMRIYDKPFMTDRDAMEIAELTAKAASEPIPRNIQDFKDHPVYALERLLRRNESIYPKRIIGHVATGKPGSKSEGQEPIYRRSDVHIVRSADKWYRLGRDVKIGEQPLKHVPTQGRANTGIIDDEGDGLFGSEIPLYAEYQTELYKAPPIIGGRVPRNVYGNLDIYTPSMVPAGGVHVKGPDAERAAKILAIDYAPAVTGFSFKGRHGTAVFDGIVIAKEYHAAVGLIIDGLENEREMSELAEKSEQALRLWKHFLLRLRIVERVKSYAVEGDTGPYNDGASDEASEILNDTGGGFLPESDHSKRERSMEAISNVGDQDYSPDSSYGKSAAREELSGGGFMPDENVGIANDTGHLQSSLKQGQTVGLATTRASHSPYYTLIVARNDETQDGLQPAKVESTTAAYYEKERTDYESSYTDELKGLSDASYLEVAEAAADLNSKSTQERSHVTSEASAQVAVQEPVKQDSDSNYQESMLSEDPEDADSFPEWLL